MSGRRDRDQRKVRNVAKKDVRKKREKNVEITQNKLTIPLFSHLYT